jgi:L-lactate dehydrogenase complex protein LldE
MRASLFITCYNDTLFPETGRAVVTLLERLGVEIHFHPKQTCCGLFEELGNEELRKQFAALLPRVYEFSEFLVDKLDVEDVGAYFPHRVTYHASCHGLRALHLGDRPWRLLNKVRGLEQVALPNLDRCCGFGGTFSVKNAEVSSAMLAVKLQDVISTRAEFCTALDNSCLMHLGGAMHRQYQGMKTIHLAEILASTETAPAEALQ